MSDRALRDLERALAFEAASLDLRREHAHLLARAGRDDEALSALDLAWRLGAEELWDELQAGLAERRVQVDTLPFCYVPAGPFVMGADDFDRDCAPAHLVWLSAFYVAERPLSYGDQRTWPGAPAWLRVWEYDDAALREPHAAANLDAALELLLRLDPVPRPGALVGSAALPSEAQWERVFRASWLRAGGENPYGVRPSPQVEWVSDFYDPATYERGEETAARIDPRGPATGRLRVVRGVPQLTGCAYALYREAAAPDGKFELGSLDRGMGPRAADVELGFAVRPAFAAGSSQGDDA